MLHKSQIEIKAAPEAQYLIAAMLAAGENRCQNEYTFKKALWTLLEG